MKSTKSIFTALIVFFSIGLLTNISCSKDPDKDNFEPPLENPKPERVQVPQWFDNARYQIHNRFWIGPESDFDKKENFYDAAFYISKMGVKAHTRHIKSESEEAIWESSVGAIHPIVKEKGNIAQKILNLSHAQGLNMICYYRHFEDSWIAEKHPDWQCRNKAGELITQRGPWISFATPYVDYLSVRLQELAKMGMDGFYFDEIHIPREGDFSAPSKALFYQYYGKDMMSASINEIKEFRQRVMDETFTKLRKDITNIKPDVVLLLSATTVRLKLLKDFYVKWEPHFFKNTPGLYNLPIAATILRDASDGRPTHCWIEPKTTDIPLSEVARYLVYNTIYNRDILEEQLDETPWTINQQYQEQIELANTFAPHIAGTKAYNWVLVHIDENMIIIEDNMDNVSYGFVNAFSSFRNHHVSVGAITDTQLSEGIPESCGVLCLPEWETIPEKLKKNVQDFKSRGGIILLKNDLQNDKIQEIVRNHSKIQIKGGSKEMDVAIYKKEDEQKLLIAFANGPQQNLIIEIDHGFIIPSHVTEVITGKEIPVKMENGKTIIGLDGFEVMAAVEIEF